MPSTGAFLDFSDLRSDFNFPWLGLNSQNSSSHEKLSQPHWLLVGIGFGCLLFTLQWVFGDLSVLSRWASTGFPEQAPDPIPYG